MRLYDGSDHMFVFKIRPRISIKDCTRLTVRPSVRQTRNAFVNEDNILVIYVLYHPPLEMVIIVQIMIYTMLNI